MSAYLPAKLRKDQAIAMCKSQDGAWQFYLRQTHTRHTRKTMPRLKTFLFYRKVKGSSYTLLTEGNIDPIWYSNNPDESSKKKKSPPNLLIFIFELRKKHFYCFFLLLANNPLDTWMHVLQRTTWFIIQIIIFTSFSMKKRKEKWIHSSSHHWANYGKWKIVSD